MIGVGAEFYRGEIPTRLCGPKDYDVELLPQKSGFDSWQGHSTIGKGENMGSIRKALSTMGIVAVLVGGGVSVPAQAATEKWNCRVRVTHVGSFLYKTEKFCPVSSVFPNMERKVSEQYFTMIKKPVLV